MENKKKFTQFSYDERFVLEFYLIRNKSFSKNHKYGRTCKYIAQEQTPHSAGDPKEEW